MQLTMLTFISFLYLTSMIQYMVIDHGHLSYDTLSLGYKFDAHKTFFTIYNIHSRYLSSMNYNPHPHQSTCTNKADTTRRPINNNLLCAALSGLRTGAIAEESPNREHKTFIL